MPKVKGFYEFLVTSFCWKSFWISLKFNQSVLMKKETFSLQEVIFLCLFLQIINGGFWITASSTSPASRSQTVANTPAWPPTRTARPTAR